MIRRHFTASSRLLGIAAGLIVLTLPALAQPAEAPAAAEPQRAVTRTSDTSVAQQWTSEYGYSILLPNSAKYNKIGSLFNKEGKTEKVNWILPGGNGSITVTYFTEPRMVPKDYHTLDSVHFYQYDSTGRNGIIHRRVYVMRECAVHVDVLLTEKGEQTYGSVVRAIHDGFVPPKNVIFALETWRYGRNPREYERGRYGQGTGPGH